MPRNSRPGTFFGDWDPDWAGSTRTERKLAQNQYDLIEAQEKANELKERELQLLEQERLDKEAEQQMEMDMLERDIRTRYCEQIGIKYDYLENFVKKLEQQKNMKTSELNKQIYELENYEYTLSELIYSKKALGISLLIMSYFFIIPLIIWFFPNNLTNIICLTLLYTFLFILGINTSITITRLSYGRRLGVNKNTYKQKLSKLKEEKTMLEFTVEENFYNFRCTHYNEEIEDLLLNKLNMYKFTPIVFQDIKNNGDFIDYNRYFLSNIESKIYTDNQINTNSKQKKEEKEKKIVRFEQGTPNVNNK